MRTQAQKAVWVAVGLILVVLSVTTILQAQAISRLQDATTQTSPALTPSFTSEPFEPVQPDWLSDSRWRIADLERQVEEDRWKAERQRRWDKAERQVEEWERWNRER